ncbi:hypothetical protein SLA2020_340360 [Shorea laevis]
MEFLRLGALGCGDIYEILCWVGNISKLAQVSPVDESKLPEKVPDPLRRRSFAEVMMQKCLETLFLSRKAMKISKMPERLTAQLKNHPEKPFALMTRSASELPKMPERPPVQPLKIPVKQFDQKLRSAPVQPLKSPVKQFDRSRDQRRNPKFRRNSCQVSGFKVSGEPLRVGKWSRQG